MSTTTIYYCTQEDCVRAIHYDEDFKMWLHSDWFETCVNDVDHGIAPHQAKPSWNDHINARPFPEIPEYLEHSDDCLAGQEDKSCPAYFVMGHADGHQHCQHCHEVDNSCHSFGCPGC